MIPPGHKAETVELAQWFVARRFPLAALLEAVEHDIRAAVVSERATPSEAIQMTDDWRQAIDAAYGVGCGAHLQP